MERCSNEPEDKLLRNALLLSNLVERISDQHIIHVFTSLGVKGHHSEVELLKKCHMVPNLIERTPDKSVMLCWVTGGCWGQLEVRLLRQMLKNLYKLYIRLYI